MFNELIRLYDANQDKAGIIFEKSPGKGKYTLLPLFHSTAKADIEITADEKGDFISAATVDKHDSFTIIPVTEKSSCRTSGAEPHLLCDTLPYLAGDYGKYTGNGDTSLQQHVAYMEQLGKWVESPYSHPKLKAVFTYLQKNTLTGDLIKNGILETGPDGLLNEKNPKPFIRFIIKDGIGDTEECWTDRTLHESWISFYRNRDGKTDMDCLTGTIQKICTTHPRKIRNDGDMTKLFSANDSRFFTYRGRFADREEAFTIGEETSAKIHNALGWIIRKQGISIGSLTVVSWYTGNPSSPELPEWNARTGESTRLTGEGTLNERCMNAEEQFLNGLDYIRESLSTGSQVVSLELDSATKGRLSLTGYRVLDSRLYLDRIRKWHEDCAWIHPGEADREGRGAGYYGVPGTAELVHLIYGVESGNSVILRDDGKYRTIASIFKSCIQDGRKLPSSIVSMAVSRASRPQYYRNSRNWEKVLSAACSLIKKYRKDSFMEKWDISLDETCMDRDYLFGRLLAVADRVEYRTYDPEKDRYRMTNARKYMTSFSMRAASVWNTIELKIQPYLKKLPPKERKEYMELIDIIITQLGSRDSVGKDPARSFSNVHLDGKFLLGFHSQALALKNTTKTEVYNS